MAAITSANYRTRGDGIVGALNGIDVALGMGSTTQTNLLDSAHAVNSANNKWTNRKVFVIDRGVVVTALGPSSTSRWQTEDGLYRIEPV